MLQILLPFYVYTVSRNESFGSSFSFFHVNLRSLKKNLESLQTRILNELNFHFSLLAVTETRINNENLDFNPAIPNYNFEFVPTPLSAGGVGIYTDDILKYRVIEKTANAAFQALWLEIEFINKRNIICGVVYRLHNSAESFLKHFEETPGGGGGTPFFGPYGDVPLDRVWVFGLAVLNRVYNLTWLCPKEGLSLS